MRMEEALCPRPSFFTYKNIVEISHYWLTDCVSLYLFILSGLGSACRPVSSSIGWRDDRSFVSPSPITSNHPSTSLTFNKFPDTYIQTHAYIYKDIMCSALHEIFIIVSKELYFTRSGLRLNFCTWVNILFMLRERRSQCDFFLYKQKKYKKYRD